MRPPISHVQLTETLGLSECHPTADHRGAWWLYDDTQEMNLVMGAGTEREAFVKALTYYQERLASVEDKYARIKQLVDDFVSNFDEEEDEWD